MEKEKFLDLYREKLELPAASYGPESEEVRRLLLWQLGERSFDTDWAVIDHPAASSLVIKLKVTGQERLPRRVSLVGQIPTDQEGQEEDWVLAYMERGTKYDYDVYVRRREDQFERLDGKGDSEELDLFRGLVQAVLSQFPPQLRK